ncbi:MAG: aldolase [Burkholderiales bacterium]|nr:MAG: aldolase [Burkholderiales bacterium]
MRSLDDLLHAGVPVFGTWLQMPCADVVDIVAASGFGFGIVDLEHGSFDFGAADMLVRACDANGVVPFVRVPDAHVPTITKALDCGAAAVIVPRIGGLDDARAAIAATRWAPDGTRGACPCVRSGGHFVRDWARFRCEREAAAGAMLLIETPGAIGAIDDICALDGLRGIVLGPFDLAVAMGLDGDWRATAVQDKLERVVRAATARGLPVVMPMFDTDPAQTQARVAHWQRLGVRLFAIGTDKIFLSLAARSFLPR